MLYYVIRNKDLNTLVPLDGRERTIGDKHECMSLIRILSPAFPAVYYELWEVNIIEDWEQGRRKTVLRR